MEPLCAYGEHRLCCYVNGQMQRTNIMDKCNGPSGCCNPLYSCSQCPKYLHKPCYYLAINGEISLYVNIHHLHTYVFVFVLCFILINTNGSTSYKNKDAGAQIAIPLGTLTPRKYAGESSLALVSKTLQADYKTFCQ